MRAIELYSELKKICDKVAYGAFKGNQQPPYIVYLQSSKVGVIIEDTFSIELYTTKRDLELEKNIEAMLKKHDVEFDVDYGIFIDESKVFMTIYEFVTYSK